MIAMTDCQSTSATLDLALLGALGAAPRPADSLLATVRELCAPWLLPTGAVLLGRLERLGGQGLVRETDGKLALGTAGRERLSLLLAAPLPPGLPHGLMLLEENLRLALLDRAGSATREAALQRLLEARERCEASQRARCVLAGEGLCGTLARHRLSLAAAETRHLRELLETVRSENGTNDPAPVA